MDKIQTRTTTMKIQFNEPYVETAPQREPFRTQEPQGPVQSLLSPSLEALRSGLETIEHSLQKSEEDVEYLDFLHERKVQLGLAPNYKEKYGSYRDDLFKSMSAGAEPRMPWIVSWVDRKRKALESDARYRSELNLTEHEAPDDSIAFGKSASVMDFVFDDASPSKGTKRPVWVKVPVKELLKPESILSRSPAQPGIR